MNATATAHVHASRQANGTAPVLVWRPRRLTARMRLTLSYALFLVVAGALMLAVIYLAMRYIPAYPLTAAHHPEAHVTASRGQILETLLRASGYALLLLAVVGLSGGWLIAGRVLRPLQEITEAAHKAANGSLDHRVGLRGPRDEFTELSDAFDHMLGRLQHSFESQQRFAANASHELRTPLAITRTMLDVAAADPAGQNYPQLVSRLRETNERGIGIVNALLQLSALGHTPVVREPVDLAGTTAEALAITGAEAGARGVTVSARYGPALVAGDGVLLRQLAVNLVQNAIRHNLPTGGSVSLSTGPDPHHDGRTLLTISNTGPLLREPVGLYTEPFLRGKGRTSEADPSRRGHGLGLSIVAGIVALHDGDLRLTPNPEGGLTLQVRLPCHRAGAAPA